MADDTTSYEDILYEEKDGAAWITINRPEKYNAFRNETCEELIHAINPPDTLTTSTPCSARNLQACMLRPPDRQIK